MEAGGERTPEVGGERTPEVGVAVLIVRGGGSVLFGRRRTAAGKDTFAPPGGHLEFGETLEDCAVREVKEETGLNIEKIEVVKLINSVILDGPHPSHFVIVLVRAVLSDPNQEPANAEPDKCEGWAWYEWSNLPNLPRPLFQPFESLMKSGFSPFSSTSHLVINA